LTERLLSAQIDVGVTMAAAPTAATMKRDGPCRRRDLAAESLSAHVQCVGGRAGKAKAAWLPPQRTCVVEVRTQGIVSLESNLTTFNSFPASLTQNTLSS